MAREIWPTRRLKSLLVEPPVYGANVPAADYVAQGLRFLRTSDISPSGTITNDIPVFVAPEDVGDEHLLRDGDLLISRSGTVGRCALYRASAGPCTHAGYLVRLRLRRTIDAKFIWYVSQGKRFVAAIERDTIQSTISNFNAQRMSEVKVPVPPIEEQRAIVRFLDQETARIDTLIEKKQALRNRLEENKSALVVHALGGGLYRHRPTRRTNLGWLTDVPHGWDIAPLYSRYDVKLGKMLDAKRITGEYLAPYVRNVNIQWDYVQLENLPTMDFSTEERSRLRLREGDLLVCEGGEVGRTAIWRGELDECYFQKAAHRLRPKSHQDVPRYLYYVMLAAAKSGHFRAGGNPNTIDHLTGEQLRHYRFPFPPRQEQEEIAEYLDDQMAQLQRTEERIGFAIDKLREYRTALITAAITGQIDVRADKFVQPASAVRVVERPEGGAG